MFDHFQLFTQTHIRCSNRKWEESLGPALGKRPKWYLKWVAHLSMTSERCRAISRPALVNEYLTCGKPVSIVLLKCFPSPLSEGFCLSFLVKSTQGLLNEWVNGKVSLFLPGFSTKGQFKPGPGVNHHKLLELLINMQSYHRLHVCRNQIGGSPIVETV